MTTPLWRVLRHSGRSHYYWRLLLETHDEEKARAKSESIRGTMMEGGVRLTKEAVEFEGWGKDGKYKSNSHGTLQDVERPREKTPCPGCRETPQEGRDKGRVCDQCEKLLDLAWKAQETANKRKGAYFSVDGYALHFPCEIGSARHWVGSDLGKCIANMVVRLAAVPPVERGSKVEELWPDKTVDGDRRHGPIVDMSKEAAAACRELYDQLKHEMAEAFRTGYESGQNLIYQLSSGEMTVKDLNDQTMKATEQKKGRRKRS